MLCFGTMEYESGENQEVLYRATLAALQSGMRVIDTAESYLTLSQVGSALVDSKIPRADVQLNSKLKGLPVDAKTAEARLRGMLSDLQTSYVDLLLIHWPGPSTVDLSGSPSEVQEACSFEYFSANIKAAWTTMIALRNAGLCKTIGVSNFYERHLRELMKHVTDPNDSPVANQIFIDPLHQETSFVNMMQTEFHMQVQAYRSTTFLPVYDMASTMGDGTQAALIAAQQILQSESKSALTLHQTVMTWLLARRIDVLFKTQNSTRMNEAQVCATLSSTSPRLDDMNQFFEQLDQDGAADMAEMCGGVDEYAQAFKGTCT